MMSQLRKEVKTIQKWAKFLLITCVLFVVGQACLDFFSPDSNLVNDVKVAVYILFVAVLSFSVLRMRHSITSTTPAKPNDRLVAVHLVNFVVYTVLFFGVILVIKHFIELYDKMKSLEEGTVEYNDVYIKFLKWIFASALI